MMVRALVPFAARINGNMLNFQAGQLIELPAGVDWLAAGLVAPVPDEVETAVIDTTAIEQAVTRKRKR